MRVMRHILTALIAFFAISFTSEAVRPVRIDTTKTHLVIPRPALEPIKSLVTSTSDAIDTLDTANEHIKVILHADNTWHYYKTPEYQQVAGVYDANWEDNSTNPYRIEQKDLPDEWAIWLVDSLDQYHCPFQGSVYHRGKFGVRRGRRHQGVDLPLKTGDPIYAAFTGKVRVSKYWGAFGNLVIIRHDNGIETFYAHLSKRYVEVGDWVNAGDVIGLGGSTGRSTGPHLHFETRYNGFAFDPQWLIDFENGLLRHRLFVLKKKYFNIYSNYEQDFDDEIKNEEDDKKEDAEREAMRWYTIKSGDTLGRIAINNGTTVNALCRLNGIKPTTTLKIGRKIRVR
ncbi:MAG: peptidoglycan DD-metalloendopeptidase family protein [Bacteroidales bacterium]|nr:peptidoglycan DD-metalloendopeptidase family protein [Bacteroidales bacterium]MBQ8573363.1 peptidoglycan DD-metalloendopeptidase family protein [Bacteroidales bacterium]MBR1960756.1 peptidoglycan DD-metalloendopeptidase family protein [Bacteroidales bacterium]